MKHFLSVNELSANEFEDIIRLTSELKKKQKAGILHKLLSGKTLAMIFSKSSTRTRVSFEAGMYQLGGYSMFLSANDIQLGRGESIYDTSMVLSRYVDGIMIRTFSHKDVEDLASFGTIPVINGLTDLMHPCQAMADIYTIFEHKGALKGLKLAYIGDGNNVANSLLHACSKAGMHIAVATPAGYECDSRILKEAQKTARNTGSVIHTTNSPEDAIKEADAVYTDTWVSMGQETDKESRIKSFSGFQVNEALFSKARKDAIFLHCLPAYRGYEVTEEVIDGPSSVVFDQAENRLHVQKAILAILMA